MREDNQGPKYFKGDDSKEINSSAGGGYTF